MQKPMTQTEIETVITQARANVLSATKTCFTERETDRGVVSELRACFLAGQDNGQAMMLERAAELVPTANIEHEAIGRAIAMLDAWCEPVAKRDFNTTRHYTVIYFGEGDPLDDGNKYRFFHGPRNETLAAAAAWVSERTARAGDTEPPPAWNEPQADDAGSDSAPVTERNL